MKILVIRIKHIGDCILCLPVISALRKRYPDAEIDYLVDKNIAELFFNHPDISNVISYDQQTTKKLRDICKELFQLRKRKYDLVIDLRVTIPTALLTRLSGAKSRLGVSKKFLRKYAYINSIQLDLYKNIIFSYLDVLKFLEINPPFDSQFPKLFLSDMERSSARNFLNTFINHRGSLKIAINFASRRLTKSWELNNFIKVIEKLNSIDALDLI